MVITCDKKIHVRIYNSIAEYEKSEESAWLKLMIDEDEFLDDYEALDLISICKYVARYVAYQNARQHNIRTYKEAFEKWDGNMNKLICKNII